MVSDYRKWSKHVSYMVSILQSRHTNQARVLLFVKHGGVAETKTAAATIDEKVIVSFIRNGPQEGED